MSQELVPQTEIERDAQKSLLAFLKSNERCFQNVLPKHLTPARFAWLVVNNVRKTPALAGCDKMSFINAVMLASNLGLEIRPNSAYLVPFGRECQLLIDYRGKMELARRAGCGAIDAVLVRENERFILRYTHAGRVLDYQPLLTREVAGKLVAVPEEERGEVVLGFACAKLPSGDWQFIEMSLGQIEVIRRRSKKGRGDLSLADIRALDIEQIPHKQRSPWITDWDEMGKKTLIHRLCKALPQTADMVVAQEIDDAFDSDAKMPIAEQLVDIVIDPAENTPLVQSGDAEAQKEVARKKIAALEGGRPKRKQRGPTRASDEIEDVLAGMADAESVGKIMALLKAQITDLAGERMYHTILLTHNVGDGKWHYADMEPYRTAAREMYELIQKATAEPPVEEVTA